MDKFKEIGTVNEHSNRFEWKIDNFLSLLEGDQTVEYSSSTIRFLYNKWSMVLSNAVEEGKMVTNLQLFRKSHFYYEEDVQISLGIVKADGTDLVLRTNMQTLEDTELSLDKLLLAQHSDLKSHQEDWMASGALTIFWTISVDYFDSDSESEEELLDKKSCESLGQDMWSMFEKGLDTDVIIKIGNCEYRAHQCILTVRSRVFHSILYEGMTKESTRTVTLADCKPYEKSKAVVRQFLEFVYTRNVRSMTAEDAISLFSFAHLLKSPDLRAWCASYLKDNMTTAVVCDVLFLESVDKEESLEHYAYYFLENHATEILEGEPWMKFLKSEPERAREILEIVEIPDYDIAPMLEIIRQEIARQEIEEEKSPKVDLVTQENRSGKRKGIVHKKINTVLYRRKKTEAGEERELEKERCESLRRDMLAMFEKGLDADITLRVKDIKFRAHQCILAVRSRLFHSILNEDMAKASTRPFKFVGFESSTVRYFLEFAYTGKFRSMTVEDAISLYKLADFLESLDLKSWCSWYLRANMTAVLVCDILALRCADETLFNSATSCLQDHTVEIMEGEAWLKFIEKEPDWANHLLDVLDFPNYDKAPMREIIRQKMAKEIEKPKVSLIKYFDGKRKCTRFYQTGNHCSLCEKIKKPET